MPSDRVVVLLGALAATLLATSSSSVSHAVELQRTDTPRATVEDSSLQHTGTDTALFAAVDRWIAAGLDRFEIAGAALAIVRNGSVVHKRGFGRGDITRNEIVSPDSSIFHIASVTKLLTAIAALQLVESGALALHEDVRSRLGELDADGGSSSAVTLHQLLTHTAGLDTRWIGMATSDPSEVRSLDEYLQHETPALIDEPGRVVRYSNHGYALVGRLVEEASGMSWAQYVEERVMKPMGMTQSYARPRALDPQHARPYRYRADTLEEPSVYEHAAPGGAVRATATDLGRLLIALLDTTRPIPVAPAAKQMILEPQSYIGGTVPAYAYGTFAYPNPYVRAASMGGEVPGFSTRLLIVPELELGVVLMVNRKDPSLAVEVFDSLLVRVAGDRSAPLYCGLNDSLASRSASGGNSGANALNTSIVGTYRSNVYERASFLRIGALLGTPLSVEADTGNSLVVVNPIENRASRYFASENGAWRTRAGECLAVVPDNNGAMLALSTRFAGPVMLERVRWFESATIVVSVVGLAVLVLVTILVVEMVRRIRRTATTRIGASRALSVSLAAGHLTFLVAFAIGLAQLAIVNDDRFAFGIPAWFSVALLIPLVMWVLTAVLAWFLLRDRRRGARRVMPYLALAASFALCLVQWSWHLYHI